MRLHATHGPQVSTRRQGFDVQTVIRREDRPRARLRAVLTPAASLFSVVYVATAPDWTGVSAASTLPEALSRASNRAKVYGVGEVWGRRPAAVGPLVKVATVYAAPARALPCGCPGRFPEGHLAACRAYGR